MYFICGAAGCGIKVIVYLNNVGKTGGPYEYIPPLWTDKIIKALGYTSGFVSDEASAKIAPPTEWKTCAAKAGTIIITDPRSVFHRAKPAKRNRYSITFGYTSQFPQVSLSEFKLSPAEWQRVNPSLSKRQLSLCSKNFRRTHVITHRSLILKSIYLINEANNSLCKAFSSLTGDRGKISGDRLLDGVIGF